LNHISPAGSVGRAFGTGNKGIVFEPCHTIAGAYKTG